MKRLSLALAAAVLFCAPSGEVRALQRVGEEVLRTIETEHPYRGPGEREVAARIREETVHYPGATYIAVHFATFQLSEGDYVVVRSPEASQSWRYEGLGRAALGLEPGGFWATHIKGDTAVVELHSRHDVGAHGFVIDKFARGYTYAELATAERDAAPGDFESICDADDSEWAKCYQTSETSIYDKSRAVARLLILGSFTCTGWLLGCEGHLVTNNHCMDAQVDASNTDFEFMAEGATCATSCFASMACPGTIAATTSQLIKTDAALDYTLVKLPTNVSATYGFMSMRGTGAVLNERIYVPQHPEGWGKRIAVFSTAAQDQSGFCEIASLNQPPCTGGGAADIGYFADTRSGSSGSPVLAYSDHKVVSLHHCANCPNRGLDTIDLIASMGADLPACATESLVGSVEIDATDYKCTDSIAITVKDDSLQGQTSHPVAVDSDTEAAGETVTLVPTSPGAGTFVGAVQLAPGPVLPGNGQVSVASGDTVTVTYVDQDDGQGGVNVPRHATADLDCAPPVISGVAAANVGTTTATIIWTTNEPATSRVTYGSTAPPAQIVQNPALVTFHSIGLGGLVQCADYVFSVTSADEVGNSATHDNGGLYHPLSPACTPPPGVADGSGSTTPLRAERLTADGSQLKIYWSNACVTPPATAKILYGPLAGVASYSVAGAVCAIPRGATPKTWTGVPPGDLWFLMTGDNSFGHEGPWGEDSAGQERNGLVSSGQCGSVEKNLSGTCP